MPVVFGRQKFSLRVLLSICFIFSNFRTALFIKVWLIRKKACSKAYCGKASFMLRVSHNTSI